MESFVVIWMCLQDWNGSEFKSKYSSARKQWKGKHAYEKQPFNKISTGNQICFRNFLHPHTQHTFTLHLFCCGGVFTHSKSYSIIELCQPHFPLVHPFHTHIDCVGIAVGRLGFAFWTFHICPFTSLTIKLKSLAFCSRFFFSLVHTLRFTCSDVSNSPCVRNMKQMRFFPL